MHHIEIKYRPVSFLNFTLSKTGSFPEDFADLSPLQLIEIYKLNSSEIDEIQFLSVMTGFKKRLLKKLSAFHRFKLMQLFGYFNKSGFSNDFIVKKINLQDAVFIAPKPKLKGVTIEQFIFADTYFADYCENNKPEDLHKFIASLYLPQSVIFSESQIETNAPLFKKSDQAILNAVALNYSFIRNWLAESYPLVFLSSPNTDADKQKAKPKAGNEWIKIFEAIVGDDIVNTDKYAQMPVNNIMRYISKRIKQNMKRK